MRKAFLRLRNRLSGSDHDTLSADQAYAATIEEITAYLDLGQKLVTVVLTFEFAVVTVIAGLASAYARSGANLRYGVATLFTLPASAKCGVLVLLFAAVVVPLLAQFTLNRCARRAAILRARQRLLFITLKQRTSDEWPDEQALDLSEDNSVAYVHSFLGLCTLLAYAGLCGWWRGAFFGILRTDHDALILILLLVGEGVLVSYYFLWRQRVLGQISIEIRDDTVPNRWRYLWWIPGYKNLTVREFTRSHPIPELAQWSVLWLVLFAMVLVCGPTYYLYQGYWMKRPQVTRAVYSPSQVTLPPSVTLRGLAFLWVDAREGRTGSMTLLVRPRGWHKEPERVVVDNACLWPIPPSMAAAAAKNGAEYLVSGDEWRVACSPGSPRLVRVELADHEVTSPEE